MTSAAEAGYRYHATVVDRRYMDWHYSLDNRCKQMDLDSVEIDHRTGAWLALIETTTNPDKRTSWTKWGAAQIGIPGYLVVLPPAIPLGPQTPISVRVIHWPDGEPPFRTAQPTLENWGRYIESFIHGLPRKAA